MTISNIEIYFTFFSLFKQYLLFFTFFYFFFLLPTFHNLIQLDSEIFDCLNK